LVVVEQVADLVEVHQVEPMVKERQIIQVVKAETQDHNLTQEQVAEVAGPQHCS
jgi:hypothetical protein|tara:strand:+ start:195 stop:356 length:162 start_codon:yes stop_codon:yes gene_type:complete